MRTVVRARIDENTKQEAAAVLDAIGLTVSDAFRMMMVRIATERRLPFDPLGAECRDRCGNESRATG